MSPCYAPETAELLESQLIEINNAFNRLSFAFKEDLNNLREGDIAVIWNTFDEDLEEVVLIHCYIKRGNYYLDVRGETTDEDKMEEGFEDFYTYDVGHVECNSKKEYMSWLDKILGESWRKEIS